MSSVDDRIVNMQFNNKQFQTGAADSAKSLDSLEAALASAAKSKGLDSLGSGVEAVKNKFSAMQVVGVTALATITNKAVDAGMRLVKSFTLEPILDGFHEYQTNLDSIQTILANTGAPLKDVNAALAALNTYSDQTIYNFGQMASAIGKFTSAGVKLGPAVDSIKGMANVAALSGASSEKLNTAMYQMSQALASGSVKLQDWNSLNAADMAGTNIQNALIATARTVDGVSKSVDKAIKKNGTFRESLKEGWLTTDVYSKTMKVFAGTIDKATGKTVAFSVEQLKGMGYTQKSAVELNKLSQAAIESATVIKTFPQLLGIVRESIGSVFAQAFQNIMGDFEQSKQLWTQAGDVLNGIIGRFGVHLNDILETWSNAKVGGRSDFITALATGFKSLGKLLQAFGQAWAQVFPSHGAQGLIGFTTAFLKFMQALTPSEGTLTAVKNIFVGIFTVLKFGLMIIRAITGAFLALFIHLFKGTEDARSGIFSLIGTVGAVVGAFGKWIMSGDKLVTIMKAIGGAVGTVVQPILQGVGFIVKAIAALASGQGLSGFGVQFELAKKAFGGLGDAAKSALGVIRDALYAIGVPVSAIRNWLAQAADEIGKLFGRLGGAGKDIQTKFQNIASALQNGSVGSKAMAAGMDKVQQSTDAAGNAVNSMYKNVTGSDAVKALTNTESLSNSAHEVSKGWMQVDSVFVGLGSLLGKIFAGLGEMISKVGSVIHDMFAKSDALDWANMFNAVLAGGILLSLRKGISTFAGFASDMKKAIMEVFDTFTQTLKTMQQAIKARAIKDIAIAVGVLTVAAIALTFVDVKKLGISLGAIGSMLGMLVGSLAALGKLSSSFSLAGLSASLVLIAGAMLILAGAIAILGNMDLATLGKGLGALAIAMGVMIAALSAFITISNKAAGPFEVAKLQFIAMGLAMIAMAVAMNILAAAVAIFGNMDLGTLLKGIGSVVILMASMTAVMTVMQTTTSKSAVSSAALLAMAISINILVGAVTMLAQLSIGDLIKGLLAVNYLLASFGVAVMFIPQKAAIGVALSILALAYALKTMAEVVILLGNTPLPVLILGIVALAAAVLLIGGAAMLVAPGLVAFGESMRMVGLAFFLAGLGMTAFGVGFALLAATGVAGVAVLTAAFSAFIALLPAIAAQLIGAFVTILETVANAAPRIVDALLKIVTAFIEGAIRLLPEIQKLFVSTIENIIAAIYILVPKLMDLGLFLIISFMTKIRDNLPQIIKLGADILIAFLQGVENESPRIANKALETVSKLIHELAVAIDKNADDIGRGAGELVKSLIHLGTSVISGLVGGLLSEADKTLSKAVETVANFIPGPIRNILGIHSPSTVMMEIGRNVVQGLANGLLKSGDKIKDAAIEMATGAVKYIGGTLRSVGGGVINGLNSMFGSGPDIRVKLLQELVKKNAFANMTSPEMESLGKQLGMSMEQLGKYIPAGVAKGMASTQVISDSAHFMGQVVANSFTKKMEIQSPSRVAMSWGEMIATGLANGMTGHITTAVSATSQLANAVLTAGNSAMNDAKKAAQKNQREVSRMQQAASTAISGPSKTATSPRTLVTTEQAITEQAKQVAEKVIRLEGISRPNMSTLQVSSASLSDAATIMSDYNDSLSNVNQAPNGNTVLQFSQVNNSPTALSASEIYRNTNNLLSALELKMGSN